MQITLINYTQNARELLIFGKNTRHLSHIGNFEDIMRMDDDEKQKEIDYVFSTISSSCEFTNYVFLLQNVTRAFCLEKGSKIITKKHREKKDRISPVYTGTKKIEDVNIGDEVWSYNEKTGKKEWDNVVFKSKHLSNNWYKVKFSNGNEITMTNEHPVYIVGRKDKTEHVPRWIPAEELKLGDQAIQTMYRGYHSAVRLRGKTHKENFGDENAEKMRAAVSKSSSKPYIERFGSIERAKIEADKRTNHFKGRTYEEICGKKKATQLLEQRSEQLKQQHKNDPEFHSTCLTVLRDLWEHEREFMIENARLAGATSHLKNPKKQSASEKKLDAFLQRNFANEFMYVGDGVKGVQLGFRTPDFISINGKKKVIELYGCWWHNCKQCFPGKKRKDHKYDSVMHKEYGDLGYDCLIIWEHEMENIVSLENKIKTFLYNPDIEITKVSEIQRSDITRYAYNIETEKNHNFFAYGILTHNTHQLVRHRVGTSFAQESLRVSPQENFSYFIPDGIESDAFQVRLYEVGMANIQESYNLLLGKGADTQDARGILPTNICTNILLGINLRALSLLMETRLCIRAQGEFQQTALWMKDLVLDVHPWMPYRVLMPACISKGICLFPRFACPLKNKYEHLKQVDDKLTKEVESDWVKMIEANYSPQPKQSK